MKKKINGIEYVYEVLNGNIHLIDAILDDGITNLSISDIDGIPVTTIGNDFLYCNKTLTSVELPNVTTIGNGFLRYNETLTSVELPNVTTIGNDFLRYNETLTSVELPNVTTIGNGFLRYNETLTSVELPNVTTIGNGFLYYNKILTINNGNIINYDGIPVFVSKRKRVNNSEINEGNIGNKKGVETFVVSSNGFHAHGKTIKDAREDLAFKIAKQNFNVDEVVREIKSTGIITLQQYRLLTGACKQGCDHFLSTMNMSNVKQLPIQEAIKLTANAYGGNRLNELFN